MWPIFFYLRNMNTPFTLWWSCHCWTIFRKMINSSFMRITAILLRYLYATFGKQSMRHQTKVLLGFLFHFFFIDYLVSAITNYTDIVSCVTVIWLVKLIINLFIYFISIVLHKVVTPLKHLLEFLVCSLNTLYIHWKFTSAIESLTFSSWILSFQRENIVYNMCVCVLDSIGRMNNRYWLFHSFCNNILSSIQTQYKLLSFLLSNVLINRCHFEGSTMRNKNKT